MLAAQGVTMAVDEKRMRGRWGLRACRGYGPLPPLPLDRGGIIHQRCRLRSDRQRPGDALLRPGTHRRDQEGRRAVERRRADRDGAPPLLKDLRLLGDAQRWGCCSRSGATGQISTPPFVELHQRPGARRGQPLGRPPARECDREGTGQACWLAIPRYSPRRYSRSGPAWAASAPKPAARERKPGSVSECANSP
jgi:hypothetical protein